MKYWKQRKHNEVNANASGMHGKKSKGSESESEENGNLKMIVR